MAISNISLVRARAMQTKFKKFDEGLESNAPVLGLLKKDPSLFAYWFFKDNYGKRFRPFVFQDLILNDHSKRVCVCISRQSGKSSMSAILALHGAFFNDNFTVVVVSATKPQAVELVRKMKVFLNTSRFTTWKTLYPSAKDSKTEIVLRNPGKKTESRIISVPATDAARGYTANMVIVDEAAFIDNGDYIFNRVVEPMTQFTKGSILLLSTPNGKRGFFWKSFNNKFWSSYQFDWRVCPNNTEKEMEEKRLRMTALEFSAEYEAKFIASQNAYFGEKSIRDSISENAGLGGPVPGVQVIGVDFGKVHDKCIIMRGVVENPLDPQQDHRVRVVERIVKPLGTDYAEIVGELKALRNMYPGVRFVLDATGVGEGPSDILQKEGLVVEAFKFSHSKKADLYSNLKILFEQGRIKIPNEVELINQLELFEYKYTLAGNIILSHPEGGHDDECDALALMAWGLTGGVSPPVSVTIV